jgi:hypothetical protein
MKNVQSGRRSVSKLAELHLKLGNLGPVQDWFAGRAARASGYSITRAG